jgi:D-3-phosphoglycerate dehydrogenase
LESGKVAAAALDVFGESPPGESPLVMHPRVIATPHLGASTSEAQVSVAVAVAEQIVDYLERGIIRNAANVPAIAPELRTKLAPYLDLARRLGQFLAQLSPGQISEMQVSYFGEVAHWDVKPITNSALVGLLSRFAEPDVNDVNAPLMAESHGISVSERTSGESAFYGPAVEIRTRSAEGIVISVLGALIQRIGFEPRILAIDDFITEAVPAGAMLVVANKDVPGMIAGMAGALSRSGINIAQMNLSRDRVGGRAMSIINIDNPADQPTLEAIRGIEGILSVRQVILED